MGPPLLATPARLAVGAGLLAGLAWAAARGLPNVVAGEGSRIPVALAGWALFFAAFWLYLHGEEKRLHRELRVARSGTSVQRRTVLRRRKPTPYFGLAMFWYAAVRVVAALASTSLGFVAVLLAEGEVAQAEAALGGIGALLTTGGLRALRAVVTADAQRAHGTEESLGEAIRALHAMPPLPQLEAERYRIHVLVKALLQQGDEATARGLAEDLKSSPDEELHVYVTWLQTWFEWSHLGPATNAEARIALLLARAHGAEDLVARLQKLLDAPELRRTAEKEDAEA